MCNTSTRKGLAQLTRIGMLSPKFGFGHRRQMSSISCNINVSFPVDSQLGQCTNGFFQDINNVAGVSRVIPLPSMNRPNLDYVQWLFPFLRFTCRGTITRWRVRVEEIDLDFEAEDQWHIPQLSTWRKSQVEGPPSLFRPTVYERVSITNKTLSTIRMDRGSVYEYELVTPTEVESGDIVGIQLPLNMEVRQSRTIKPLFLELMSGNASINSHIKLENSTLVVISSVEVVQPLQTFIPLISVRIGEIQYYNYVCVEMR